MPFEIIGPIHNTETIAAGPAIRALPRLRKHYGEGRWRKLKGVAVVRLSDVRSGRPKYIGTRRAESDEEN